jgi:protein-tyrosine phosphatase
MPGRSHPLAQDRQEILDASIDTVYCLASLEEARSASPEYAEMIESGQAPWRQWMYTVPESGVPLDKEQYLEQLMAAAENLRAGGRLLMHCVGGIGRTRMAANCLLMILGMDYWAALTEIFGFGLEPESPKQYSVIQWVAERLGRTM